MLGNVYGDDRNWGEKKYDPTVYLSATTDPSRFELPKEVHSIK